MCGIIAGFGDDVTLNQDILDRIDHRGPDDSGIFQDKNLFLAHVRLSIQDVTSHGHQPMISDDQRYCLIFNGEIYNHFELRGTLARQTSEFRSTSDTETLLYGLIQFGPDFINKLNGIFAFAFYDSLNKELIIARDQFGVKPLYYLSDNSRFLLCSELKGLLPFLKDPTLNSDRVKDYLSFLWCPGEGTPLAAIKKVLPGHYVRLSLDGRNCLLNQTWTRYYTIPFYGLYSSKTEADLIDLLDEALVSAVRRQLLADVPVGFFLSGGVDSSLLVAIAKRICKNRLQCFTIETEINSREEGFHNDLSYAKMVAKHLDVDLEVVRADVNIVRDFDHMIWHLDEPQADAAPLNVANISRRAREMGYKVLIGGTAGDDLFSGYRRHQAIRLEKYLEFIPSCLLQLASKLAFPSTNPLFRRLNKVLREVGKARSQRLANYFVWLPKERVDALLTSSCDSSCAYEPTTYLLKLLKDIPEESSWLNRMLYWEMRSFLVDHNLNYTDKMGMAHGVEIRVPFLDLNVVELACQIPPALKLKGDETKYILKKVAERYLPHDVIYRSKTGFGAPVRKWILNDLDHLIKRRLLTPSLYNSILNLREVQKLVNDNKSGKIDASYSIWALLALESWIRQFLFSNAQSK